MHGTRDLRRPATVLHTSDCHLGAVAYGGRADLVPAGREEAAFARAMSLARDLDVDAVVIAGDLFDSARMSDEILAWTAAQIDTLACPVVIVPGNHDVYDERSVHHRFDIASRCGHARFIGDHAGRAVDIPGTDVVVWARAMIEHEPGYLPFAGLPARPAGRWTIAVGHGLLHADGPALRSSPIFEGDLAGVDWDYVALGHVHVYREVRDHPTPVRYCGATATSRDGAAGVVVVDFVPGEGAKPRWIGLEPDDDDGGAR